ncbi:hypothetical protein BC937DRAFT_95070 [Endogone sp. FLAS-F59071]|nr:hypothetical protein BC937DRAFT_95070 [Endogone sp. FLAS-F59071]|eukprot:RUS20501.1 hypothetical protein BC937DRAFT_95070 [Endogone sp. FLAS-F59071]
MGGNALKNCTLRRITAAEYAALSFHILSIVRRYYAHADIPHCFPTKPDHGDLDIVVSVPIPFDTTIPVAHSLWPNLIRKLSGLTLTLAHEFQSKDLFVNGPVTSFEHTQFQIDLISVPPRAFSFAVAYLSWGDLGNMLGVVANRLGVSYGASGLTVCVFSPLHGKSMRIGRVTLTESVGEALKFLGYDIARWERGFDDKEEVFEFVASGKYFEPWMFCGGINSRNRRRMGKRPMFNGFLEYVKKRFPTTIRKSEEDEGEGKEGDGEEGDGDGEEGDGEGEGGEGKEDNHSPKIVEDEEDDSGEHSLTSLQLEHRARALETFDKQAEYQLHLARYEAAARVRELWNPAVQNIQRTRDLRGKELGKFIQVYKESKLVFVNARRQTWEDWVLTQENTMAIVEDMEKYHDYRLEILNSRLIR